MKNSVELEEVVQQYHNLKKELNKVNQKNILMKSKIQKMEIEAAKKDEKLQNMSRKKSGENIAIVNPLEV